jgi:hypothetical protein
MAPQAKQRKRDAIGNLRELADELGVPANRRQADLSKFDFVAFHSAVARKGSTPEHRARLDAAVRCWNPAAA